MSEPSEARLRRSAAAGGRGFTLVELLVVLTIVAILVGIAIPFLIGNPQQRQLSSAASKFTADMRFARSRANRESSRVFVVFERSVDSTQVQRPWVDGDNDGANDSASGDPVLTSGSSVVPPLNPGVGRTAQTYYIIQEKERTFPGRRILEEIENRIEAIKANASGPDQALTRVNNFLSTAYLEGNDPRLGWVGKMPAIVMRPNLTVGEVRDWLSTKVGTDFTYLDLYNDVRIYRNLSNSDQATVTEPKEPHFPRKVDDVAPASGPVTVEDAHNGSAGNGTPDSNMQAWPLLVSPMRLNGLSSMTSAVDLDFSYQERLCPSQPVTAPYCAQGSNITYNPDFFTEEVNQYVKLFSDNSFQSLRLMKRADDGSAMNFTEDPDGENPNQPVVEFNSAVDNPELREPVVDYTLIRERELGNKVYLTNPFTNLYLSAFENDIDNASTWRTFSPQSLQYAITWNADGTMSVNAWTWAPTPFPSSNDNVNRFEGQVHGDWVEVSSALDLQPRMFFMVTEKSLAFENTSAFGTTPSQGIATRIAAQSTPAQKDSNAVRITFWPSNGQERVDSYTPNDRSNRIFEMPPPTSNGPPYTDVANNFRAGSLDLGTENINVVRSEGFNQNYLVP